MAASKAKKGVSKEDLRRLMRAQQTSLKGATSAKKIESPLAKYNSWGELSCVVCSCAVKSEALWSAHVQGRAHKENIERTRQQSAASVCPPPSSAPLSTPSARLTSQGKPLKRKATEEGAALGSHVKLAKVTSSVAKADQSGGGSQLPADFFDASPSTSSAPVTVRVGSVGVAGGRAGPTSSDSSPGEEDSSSDEAMEQSTTPPSAVLPPSTASQLPPDFFDAKVPMLVAESVPTIAEKLPEGFFDDSKMDAKVRHVVYRDKKQEEWESFQRAMKEEATVSEALAEEDDEQRDAKRSIYEIDDQMNRWGRVLTLQQRLDALKAHARPAPASAPGGATAPVTPPQQSDSDSEPDPAVLDSETSEDWWRHKTLRK